MTASGWVDRPTQVSWHGLPAQRYATDRVSVVVVPQRGGKIASLLDGEDREWLEQPAAHTEIATLETPFTDGDMCGWDECAPTIVACEVDGVALPDHGELWSRPWSVGDDGSLHVTCPSYGYTFSRSIAVRDATVRLRYRVAAASTRVPMLWAAHPQFRAFPGTTVSVGEHADYLWDVLAEPAERIEISSHLLSLDTVEVGSARKFYLDPGPRAGRVDLIHADGSQLQMQWSDEVKFVGVWFDRGRYSRHDVIAIEPSTGFYDSCRTALSRAALAVIEPGGTLDWTVNVTVTPPPRRSPVPVRS